MAAIAGLPPQNVRDLLLADGWEVIDETENIWLLAERGNPKSTPLPLPKHGDVVDPEIMDWLAHRKPSLGRAVVGAVQKHVAKKPTTVPPPPSSPMTP